MSQTTLGFMESRIMPVAPHSTDLVKCEDTGEYVERSEATECNDGLFWSDIDELLHCQECEGLFDSSQIDDHNGHCESCYNDKFVVCDSCADPVEIDDSRSSEAGDVYCESCYCDRFIGCAVCCCEIDIENDSYSQGRYGDIVCSDCAPNEEWEQDYNWSGCANYDLIGSPRKFGIELETDRCDGYEDWAHGMSWGAKEDGSIQGKEFVSPPLYGNDGYRSVMDFCDTMEREDCDANEDCGYHLHIDLSDTNAEQRKCIALAYHYTRHFWEGCTASHRRNYHYCHRSDWSRDGILGGSDYPSNYDRYTWLNWSAYRAHNTVEVRSHEGTCNGREVLNWVKAHTRFVDCVKDMTVGQITRIFGSEQPEAILRELRHIWKDDELTDFYANKACIGRAVAAA